MMVRRFHTPLQWGMPCDDGKANGPIPGGGARTKQEDSFPGSEGPGFGWERLGLSWALTLTSGVTPPLRVSPLFSQRFMIFLFLVVLGLHCCALSSGGCSPVAAHGLLVAVASPAAGRRLQAHGPEELWLPALELRLSSCGRRALLLCGTWDLPRPRTGPLSVASQGRFLPTGPPEMPLFLLLLIGG